jgi:hypothetical protein
MGGTPVTAPFMTTYGNHEVLLGEGFDDWHDRFPQPDESGLQGGRFYSFTLPMHISCQFFCRWKTPV